VGQTDCDACKNPKEALGLDRSGISGYLLTSMCIPRTQRSWRSPLRSASGWASEARGGPIINGDEFLMVAILGPMLGSVVESVSNRSLVACGVQPQSPPSGPAKVPRVPRQCGPSLEEIPSTCSSQAHPAYRRACQSRRICWPASEFRPRLRALLWRA